METKLRKSKITERSQHLRNLTSVTLPLSIPVFVGTMCSVGAFVLMFQNLKKSQFVISVVVFVCEPFLHTLYSSVPHCYVAIRGESTTSLTLTGRRTLCHSQLYQPTCGEYAEGVC